MEVNIYVAIMLLIIIVTGSIMFMISIRYSDKTPSSAKSSSKKKYRSKKLDWDDDSF